MLLFHLPYCCLKHRFPFPSQTLEVTALQPQKVFGKNLTCVVLTKYLRLFQMCGKNHTCVWKTKPACVFPNTGWYFLYLILYLTNIIQISYLIYISFIQDAQTQFCGIGKIGKIALNFTCVGIPTHIKQQNNNNNIKKITFDMCAPPRFCTQLWALQRYFCLFVIFSGLKSTTLKPIYWFWANGDSLLLKQRLTFYIVHKILLDVYGWQKAASNGDMACN